MKLLDYLIVGQGLAGTLLSHHLLRRGKKVKVLDAALPQAASRAAAGIFNPVTGRSMVKTWKADALFPYLLACYQEIERLTNTHFLHNINMYRPFSSIREQNEWLPRADNKEFAPYVEYVAGQHTFGQYVHDSFGGLVLRQTGYVNLPVLINVYKTYLKQKDAFEKHHFSEALLSVYEDHVIYNGCAARKMIFCEGPASSTNAYFDWLPFRLVKGEILFVKLANALPMIFNKGIFVLPLEDGLHRVGATYDHAELNSDPTQKARTYLCEKLEALLKTDYEVVGQVAGVRPATKDRRPMIGLHPEFKPLGIFNGFGSKGVSLAPYFANHFAAFLEEETALEEAVDINRFIEDYCSPIVR